MNVTAENWRVARDHYADVFEDQDLIGVATALLEVGWAEKFDLPVDDAFCAAAVQGILDRSSSLLVCVEGVGFNADCADPWVAWYGGYPVCARHAEWHAWAETQAVS